jgi:putative transposase
VEVWTRNGLTTFYILVAMRLKTRRVEIAGVTENPDGIWVKQMARNLTGYDGFLLGAGYLLIDRDTKFLPLRTCINKLTDTKIVLLPPRSPNLNAHLERFMRSLKSECLDRMIFFGRRSLERALKQFVAHYHLERSHQGLENRIIDPSPEVGREIGEIQCRERLGGILRYYYREAAQRSPSSNGSRFEEREQIRRVPTRLSLRIRGADFQILRTCVALRPRIAPSPSQFMLHPKAKAPG